MSDDVREKLRREFTSEEYTAVRDLWKAHSLAEDGRSHCNVSNAACTKSSPNINMVAKASKAIRTRRRRMRC